MNPRLQGREPRNWTSAALADTHLWKNTFIYSFTFIFQHLPPDKLYILAPQTEEEQTCEHVVCSEHCRYSGFESLLLIHILWNNDAIFTHRDSYLPIRTLFVSIDSLQKDSFLVLCVALHLHHNVVFGGLLFGAADRNKGRYVWNTTKTQVTAEGHVKRVTRSIIYFCIMFFGLSVF